MQSMKVFRTFCYIVLISHSSLGSPLITGPLDNVIVNSAVSVFLNHSLNIEYCVDTLLEIDTGIDDHGLEIALHKEEATQ